MVKSLKWHHALSQVMTTMLLQRGKKVEITQQLRPEAATHLARWIGCFGVVWNLKVGEDESAFKFWCDKGKPLEPRVRPNQAAAHFVDADRPWLAQVPSQIRRNAAAKWFEAKTAAIKGLRKNPRRRKPFGKKSCLVTSELFTAEIEAGTLCLRLKSSHKAQPFCTLMLPAGTGQCDPPRSVVVSRIGSRFFLSWSYEFEAAVDEEHVLQERLAMTPFEEQEKLVLGVDLGVAQPVTVSDGSVFDFSPGARHALKKLDAKKRRYQRGMARCQKGSKNRRKQRERSARVQSKSSRIRKDFLHKTAKSLAHSVGSAVVFEDLRITNMVRRPKAKPVLDVEGTIIRFEKNRAAQKAGLNRAILNVGWGELRTLLTYKLRERNKFLAVVPPHFSSQECAACGHVDAGNRLTQSQFRCLHCGHTDNADLNASKVIKKRFLSGLRKGTLLPKSKAPRRIAVRRKPVTVTPPEARCKPVEPVVRLRSNSEQGRRSRKGSSAREACSGSGACESMRLESRSSFL